MKSYKSTVFTLLFLGTFMLFMGAAAAEVGVTDTTIKIGNISDTTGPIAAYGVPRTEAAKALCQSINDAGGINGRKLIFLHENDAYKPPNTVLAFKKLVEMDQVFGFIGSLGVATTMAVVPEIQSRKVPYIFPGGNSGKLFNPPMRYIFGINPSYEDFMRILIDRVALDFKMPNAKIAHIQQDDETGHDSHRGVLAQLPKYPGMKLVSHEIVKRGTVDVSSQVANMRKANPDVILMSPIFVTNAMIAKEIQKIGWKPLMMMNASSGSPAIIKLGGPAVEGAIVQICQKNLEDDIPANHFYKEVMKKYLPDSKTNPSQYGATGFNEVLVAVEGLKRAGRDLTREGYIDAMETLKDFEIGGSIPPQTYGKDIRQGTNKLIHVKVQDGKFVNDTDWVGPK